MSLLLSLTARRATLLLALAPAAGAQHIHWTFGEGSATPGDLLGQSVALLHEPADAGHHDVIVGAPGDTDGQFGGSVWVLRGDDDSLVLHSHHGALGSELGFAVAAVGDVNGDGREDYAAGEPGSDGGFTDGGGFAVYSGATGNFLYERFGPKAGARLGEVLAGLGDVNGDGFGDFLAGAPSWDGPLGPLNPDRGYVALYSGKTGAILRSWTGAHDGDRLGASLAGLPDLNADGRPEFALGEPGLEVGSPFSILDAGGCRVYSGKTQALLVEVFGTSGGEALGSSVCALGDSDKDGKLEFAVGGPGWSNSRGHVLVCEGSQAKLVTTLTGSEFSDDGDQFGFAVGPAGDLDKDGRDDLIVTEQRDHPLASNYARAFRSSDWSVYGFQFPGLPGAGFGRNVASGFDVNGDGWPDAFLGLPNFELGSDAGFVRGYDFLIHQGDAGITAFGPATLDIYGTKLFTGGQADLLITDATPNKPVFLLASPQQEIVGFKGGTLVPDAAFGAIFVLQADAAGKVYVPGIPGGGAGGVVLVYVQAVMKSNDAPQGWWLTNALEVLFYA
jgi:hypothetical protein